MPLTHLSSPIFIGVPTKSEASRTSYLSGQFNVNIPAGYPTTKEGFGGGLMLAPLIMLANIQPLTLNAANLAASQSPAAGAITLSAAAAGVTLVTVNGQTRYRFDVPRAIQIVSGGNDTGITFTITGYDIYGQPLVEGPTAGANAGAKNFAKAFYEVVSVTHTGSIASTVTIGTRDTLGPFPARIDLWENLIMFYNGALVTSSTGFTAAVTTDPATGITGDVRGTYALQSASDGTKRLVVYGILPNIAGSAKQLYGIDQFGG